MEAARPTVLICEDEPYLRELVRATLAPGYRFVEAATVAEADEALVLSHPDIVLLDLMLPGGSGLDVLRAVRRLEPRIPVVIVSAWTTPEYRRAAEEAGADAFMAKPFVPQELAALVARLVEDGDG